MELQNKAIEVIEAVCLKLDPLFKMNGFTSRTRQSDTSIFYELVGYEKEDIEFHISVCMHPHDYPNSLNVYLIRKIPGNWKYIQLNELLQIGGEKGILSEIQLFVEPGFKLSSTVSRLYQTFQLIFERKIV